MKLKSEYKVEAENETNDWNRNPDLNLKLKLKLKSRTESEIGTRLETESKSKPRSSSIMYWKFRSFTSYFNRCTLNYFSIYNTVVYLNVSERAATIFCVKDTWNLTLAWVKLWQKFEEETVVAKKRSRLGLFPWEEIHFKEFWHFEYLTHKRLQRKTINKSGYTVFPISWLTILRLFTELLSQ